MVECIVKTRKMGNSLGVTLPKTVVTILHLKPKEKIYLIILKSNNSFRENFGILKGKLKKSTQKMKDELRKELS
ncbi:MAG TPA: hypothetical protein VJB87_02455 [Candidatus Nanoarchaeia archaeon]|nr:hypothetical protein [Candidatus Nanoarchaeia archaeon]